jgi:hypothetical protein
MVVESDPLESIWLIVLIWSFSLIMMSILLVIWSRRIPEGLKRVRYWNGQEGFAYSLSFIMTIPLMILVFIAFIETTLVMIAQGGVVYAAFVAARSAVVWDAAQPDGIGAEKVHLAAAHALAPFASGNPKHLNRKYQELASQDISYAYTQAYFKYVGKEAKVSNNYLVRKLYYARQSMRLYHIKSPSWDSIQKVTVSYEHPFYFPLIGRLLGSPSNVAPGVRVFQLKYTSQLQNEGAMRADQKLGIRYDSDY